MGSSDWRASSSSSGDGRRANTEGLQPQRLKLMWDYTAFPVWDEGGAMVEPGSLPVGEGLRNDLQAWSDRMTDVMWGPRGPDDPTWDGPDDAALEALVAEGMALAERLQQELPANFSVVTKIP